MKIDYDNYLELMEWYDENKDLKIEELAINRSIPQIGHQSILQDSHEIKLKISATKNGEEWSVEELAENVKQLILQLKPNEQNEIAAEGGIPVGFGYSRQWNATFVGVWERIGANKVTYMTRTEQLIIRRKLIAAREDPEVDLFRLSKQLMQPDVDWRRAKLIARTETGQAAGMGQNEQAKQAGFLMSKEWITHIDGRERMFPRDQTNHKVMNKVVVDMDKYFSIPNKKGFDLLEFAHDHNGPAAQVCNCRCKTVYVPKRDKNGRLIRT